MNKEILDAYVAEGWLMSQVHPTLPLTIYNYTQKTQYDGHWDEVTLACRGLIVDSLTGEILVKPMPKFFNYEEKIDETEDLIDSSEYIYVQEKMDGSLGILFNYKGEWVFSSRGSFTSDQAIKGMEILRSKYDLSKFIPDVAYIGEILYESNRIVVNYGDLETFIFITASTPEGELNWATANATFKSNGILEEDIVPTLMERKKEDLFRNLKDKNESNKEGFVLRFYPSGKRCKIKFEEYVRLHRIVTQVSSYDVWEFLKTNGELPETFLNNVPDEFYDWVRKTEISLKSEFKFVKSLHNAQVNSILKSGDMERKQIAEAFLSVKDSRISTGILFLIADGRDPDQKIWQMVKPLYSRPFETKFEEEV
jgi:RNA ligase